MVRALSFKEQKSNGGGPITSTKGWAHLWSGFPVHTLGEQPLNKNSEPWENLRAADAGSERRAGTPPSSFRVQLLLLNLSLSSSSPFLLEEQDHSLCRWLWSALFGSLIIPRVSGVYVCEKLDWELACSKWWDRIPCCPSAHVSHASSFRFLTPSHFLFPFYSLFMSSFHHWKIPLRFLPHENLYLSDSAWIWQFNYEIRFSSSELSMWFSPKQPSPLNFSSPQSAPMESKFY